MGSWEIPGGVEDRNKAMSGVGGEVEEEDLCNPLEMESSVPTAGDRFWNLG